MPHAWGIGDGLMNEEGLQERSLPRVATKGGVGGASAPGDTLGAGRQNDKIAFVLLYYSASSNGVHTVSMFAPGDTAPDCVRPYQASTQLLA